MDGLKNPPPYESGDKDEIAKMKETNDDDDESDSDDEEGENPNNPISKLLHFRTNFFIFCKNLWQKVVNFLKQLVPLKIHISGPR